MALLDPTLFDPSSFRGGPSPLASIVGAARVPFGLLNQPGAFEDATLPPGATSTAGGPLPQLQAQQPGFFGSLGSGIANNSNMLMALGAGIAGGKDWGEGISKGLMGGMQGAQIDRTRGSENLTYQALIKRGLDPETAMAAVRDKTLLAAVLPALYKAQMKPLSAEQKSTLGLQSNLPWFAGPDGRPTLPEGFASVAPKFEKVGPGETGQFISPFGGPTGQVISGGPEKPPSGFEWVDTKDTSKGVKAIAGGPATHVPAEAAGRIALMDAARGELPAAKQVFMNAARRGWAGGQSGQSDMWGDVLGFYTGSGDMGRARLGIRGAIEAALRAATGAAAPETEVKRYEALYLPQPGDTEKTAEQKLRMLETFLDQYKSITMQGRSATPGQTNQPQRIRIDASGNVVR